MYSDGMGLKVFVVYSRRLGNMVTIDSRLALPSLAWVRHV